MNTLCLTKIFRGKIFLRGGYVRTSVKSFSGGVARSRFLQISRGGWFYPVHTHDYKYACMHACIAYMDLNTCAYIQTHLEAEGAEFYWH